MSLPSFPHVGFCISAVFLSYRVLCLCCLSPTLGFVFQLCFPYTGFRFSAVFPLHWVLTLCCLSLTSFGDSHCFFECPQCVHPSIKLPLFILSWKEIIVQDVLSYSSFDIHDLIWKLVTKIKPINRTRKWR